MKFTNYRITFTTGEIEIVKALGRGEAGILAQANQIRKGNIYEIQNIEEVTL